MAGAPGTLTEIKVTRGDGATRVVVAVNGVIDIKSDRIENPPRVFVDFLGTVPRLAGKGDGVSVRAMQSIPVGDGVVRQIRVAENQKGVTRLVFDLEREDVDYRTAIVKGESKLLVELRAKTVVSGMRNPLAAGNTANVVAVKPPVRLAPPPVRKPLVGVFRMGEPPTLPVTTKLPRAEAAQMPYLAGGYVFRDWRVRPPMAGGASNGSAVAAARTSAGRQSLTRVLGLKIGKVVIDPGHGGHDAGSTGVTGLTEKELTLDIAKRLGQLITDRLASEVVFTRSEDVYVPLEQRTAIANQSHADLFISIHANASNVKSATGVETYYLNFTSSPEALEVAARENASSERGVSDLGDLIKKIALKDKIDESREFAAKVQNNLFAGSTKAGNRTKDRGVRKAPFVVLIGAQMPSVLTEIGFLSNAKEEALLRKPEYRQKIAEAIFKGISQYASTLSHFNLATTAFPDEN
jgi:N-acetylmuramoyl-L-alanine amidase